MPVDLPSTDPGLSPAAIASPGNVLVVYNTDVAYSLILATRYARRKRIPTANLLGFAMGTGNAWVHANNTDFYNNCIVPVNTALTAISGKIVLVAPGCPKGITYVGLLDVSGDPTATAVTPSLVLVLSCTRQFEQVKVAYGVASYGANYIAGTGYLPTWNYALHSYRYFSNHWLEHYLGHMNLNDTVGVAQSATYVTTYNGLDGGAPTNVKAYIPTDTAISELGNANSRVLPCGRIGVSWQPFDAYSYDGSLPTAESYEDDFTVMERGLRYAEACAPGNRYRVKIHFQFDGYFANYRNLAYLHSQLLGWGYDSSYFSRQSTGDADMETYAPHAGSAYTLADLDAGKIQDIPYHLMLGDGSNFEMLAMPYIRAWKPDGGGGLHMGPSEGWQYAVNQVRRGGVAGTTTNIHTSVIIYQFQYCYAHNLLRGMSWVEAAYFTGIMNYHMIPMGDPLARPFPT